MRIQKSFQGLVHEDDPNLCPECGSRDLEYQRSEQVCLSCGLVIE